MLLLGLHQWRLYKRFSTPIETGNIRPSRLFVFQILFQLLIPVVTIADFVLSGLYFQNLLYVYNKFVPPQFLATMPPSPVSRCSVWSLCWFAGQEAAPSHHWKGSFVILLNNLAQSLIYIRIQCLVSHHQVPPAPHICSPWPRSCPTHILDTGLHASERSPSLSTLLTSASRSTSG